MEQALHINDRELMADERNERFKLLGLTVPALLLITFVVLISMAGLFWQSFYYKGVFTFANYERIILSDSYWYIFRTTFLLSIYVTALAILLGYPLAYFISQLPSRYAPIFLGLILLPFWTSVIVRTYAWLVILQRTGIINKTLIHYGIIEEPLRLAYNFNATVIGMLHIMLPFLVLPLYSSMKAIDPDYRRAAISLGASPTRSFWTVFYPLTLPGLNAGAILVFVNCLGFYITPQILGGGRVVTLSMQVYDNATLYSDWGAASSLGFAMLVLVFGFLYLGNAFSKILAKGRR